MRHWTVRDVMTNEVLTVSAEADASEVVALMTSHEVSALAVVDDFDVVIGVVTRGDVLRSLTWPQRQRPGLLDRLRGRTPPALTWRRSTARQMMTAPALTIDADRTTEHAARRMHRAGIKRLLVTDHRRGLLGVVTAADLFKVLGRPDDALRADVVPQVDSRPRDPVAATRV